MTENGIQAPHSSVTVPFTLSGAAKVQPSDLARLPLSWLSDARSMQASKSKAPPPRPHCITLGAVLDLRTTTACEPQRSNSASVTDAFSSLRCAYGAAQRGR
jgi:hypothetical protein